MKTAMPHENINFDNSLQGYDALAECLVIISELGACNHEMQDMCTLCNEKITGYGFSPAAWAAYRGWMQSRFPERFKLPVTKPNIQESTKIFMNFMKNKLPVFNRQSGQFLGYYNRETQKLESPMQEKTSCWVYENCRFASQD